MQAVTGPSEKRAKLSHPEGALQTGAAKTAARPPLPPPREWLEQPPLRKISLLGALPDPTLAIALWHAASQNLVSCSANFARIIQRPLPQLLQQGFSWSMLFNFDERESDVSQSRDLLVRALTTLRRGEASRASAVLATKQHYHEQLHWLSIEFSITADPAMVLTLVRELPTGEPWLQLRKKNTVTVEQQRQLVPMTPPKRRNVSHPWDSQVMHFRLMVTQ